METKVMHADLHHHTAFWYLLGSLYSALGNSAAKGQINTARPCRKDKQAEFLLYKWEAQNKSNMGKHLIKFFFFFTYRLRKKNRAIPRWLSLVRYAAMTGSQFFFYWCKMRYIWISDYNIHLRMWLNTWTFNLNCQWAQVETSALFRNLTKMHLYSISSPEM